MRLHTELFSAPLPTLKTERLVLRAVGRADLERVESLLSDREVAEGTLTIPHPYPAGGSQEWFAAQGPKWADGKMATWAITRGSADEIIGVISLRIVVAHRRAEAGYWVAREAWGGGVATDALRAVIAWGFDTLGLHRIEAHHFTENGASGRVMQKAGMHHEGHVRGAVHRHDVPRDLELYGMLRTDPRR
jgi:ribosomal-protein-alanine N-acetyltransferase